jgi:hypothetical protein
MADTKKPTINATPDKKPLHWWWHDDDYVANDTWNFLAVGEVVVAFCLYYWLASISSWPLLTVLSFISVPILLLRSEASIKRGLDLLGKSIDEREPTIHEIWLIGLISFIVSASLCYWLVDYIAQYWLFKFSGWELFWRSALIGVVSLALALAGTVALAGMKSTYTAGRISIAFGALAGAGVLAAGVGVVATAGAVTGVGAAVLSVTIAGGGVVAGTVSAFSLLGLVIGICLHSLQIRIRATVPYLKSGLAAFSHNWHETVFVSNMRHAPALIPRAGQIRAMFNVATLDFGTRKDLFNFFLTFTIALAITLVATIYRWNIKANSWIWAPLALLMRPIAWERSPLTPAGKPPDSRRTDSAFWSHGRIITTSALIYSILLAYLIYPNIPKDIQEQLPTWTAVITAYIPLHTKSLRYWLAVFLVLALSYQIFCAFKMSACYQDQLAKSDVYSVMSLEVESGFDAAATRLVRARLITFASFLLFVYAFAIKYALDKWPNDLPNVVWDWLKPLL